MREAQRRANRDHELARIRAAFQHAAPPDADPDEIAEIADRLRAAVSAVRQSDAEEPGRRPAVETVEMRIRQMRDLATELDNLPLELWGYDAPHGIPPLLLDHDGLADQLRAHSVRLLVRRDLLVAGRQGKKTTRPERPLPRIVTDWAAEAFEHLSGHPPTKTVNPATHKSRGRFLTLLGSLFDIFAIDAKAQAQFKLWQERQRLRKRR